MPLRWPDGTIRICKTHDYVFEKHNGQWIRQHRLRMEKKLGRKIRPSEVVHHKNGIRSDNRLRNLEVMLESKHARLHHTGRKCSAAARKKMSEAALALLTKSECKRRSIRAKKQHRGKNFGAHIWKSGPNLKRKLSPRQIASIRRSKASQVELGKRYGVAPSTIFKARSPIKGYAGTEARRLARLRKPK